MTATLPEKKIVRPPAPFKIPNPPKDLVQHALDGFHAIFKFGEEDKGGPWPWVLRKGGRGPKKGFSASELAQIMDKMGAFGKMTREQLRQDGSHPTSIHTIVEEARIRLGTVMGRDWEIETDELFSFKITKPARLWCIEEAISQEKAIYKILWWDPKHEICPIVPREILRPGVQ